MRPTRNDATTCVDQGYRVLHLQGVWDCGPSRKRGGGEIEGHGQAPSLQGRYANYASAPAHGRYASALAPGRYVEPLPRLSLEELFDRHGRAAALNRSERLKGLRDFLEGKKEAARPVKKQGLLVAPGPPAEEAPRQSAELGLRVTIPTRRHLLESQALAKDEAQAWAVQPDSGEMEEDEDGDVVMFRGYIGKLGWHGMHPHAGSRIEN